MWCDYTETSFSNTFSLDAFSQKGLLDNNIGNNFNFWTAIRFNCSVQIRPTAISQSCAIFVSHSHWDAKNYKYNSSTKELWAKISELTIQKTCHPRPCWHSWKLRNTDGRLTNRCAIKWREFRTSLMEVLSEHNYQHYYYC